MPCFGGADMKTLYFTSLTAHVSAEVNAPIRSTAACSARVSISPARRRPSLPTLESADGAPALAPKMKAAVPHGTPPSSPIAKNNKGGILYCFLPVLIFREAPTIETLGNKPRTRQGTATGNAVNRFRTMSGEGSID